MLNVDEFIFPDDTFKVDYGRMITEKGDQVKSIIKSAYESSLVEFDKEYKQQIDNLHEVAFIDNIIYDFENKGKIMKKTK